MVLDMLGPLDGAVPVIQVAKALDVSAVRVDRFDGFEGMLLTDRRRTDGVILANKARGDRRARFTVAHELGHFLMERHEPSEESGFRCMPSDMRERRKAQQHSRQEAEANRFAIELLAPSASFEQYLDVPPNLGHVSAVADSLKLSKEATARRYTELTDARIAMVFHRHGIVRYPEKAGTFPYLALPKGSSVPVLTGEAVAGSLTNLDEADPKDWSDGPPMGELWAQTLHQSDGFGITMLFLEQHDPEDDDGVEELGLPRFRR